MGIIRQLITNSKTKSWIWYAFFGLSKMNKISNEEMDDIMKIVMPLEESGLLIKGVNETIKNEAKEQRVDFSACY